jgi:hypothetical protein
MAVVRLYEVLLPLTDQKSLSESEAAVVSAANNATDALAIQRIATIVG